MSRIKQFVRRHLLVILVILVVVLALAAGYFYKKSTSNTDKQAIAEAKTLVRKVGKLVVLPEGETPTIATVSDPEALRDQEFFAGAKLGDKVLIYSAAKKAILYDPAADRVITIAPLNIAAGNSPSAASSDQ